MEENKVIIAKSDSSQMIVEHFHNTHEILYISKGKVSANISGTKYIVGEGTMIFISNLEVHQIDVLEYPYSRYYALIPIGYSNLISSNNTLNSIFSNRTADFKHCIEVVEYRETIEDFFEKMHCEYEGNKEFCDENIISYFTQLIVFLYRNKKEFFPQPQSNVDDIIYKVKKYIELNFARDITVNDIANKFYLNNSYLSHAFKKTTGYNPKQFIMLCRLAQSRALLFNTNLSIVEVAAQTGFTDVNNFIRYFKKEVGITPSQYRKTSRIH